MAVLEHLSYGFRKTGQDSDKVLSVRECSEQDNFMQFKGYVILKEQYAALVKLCKQYRTTPEGIFKGSDSFEAEAGLVTKIDLHNRALQTFTKQLTMPEVLTQLEYLDISFCAIEQELIIPKTLARLKYFDCSWNTRMGKLIISEAFEELETINCEAISAFKLPLPKTLTKLTELYCSRNHLQTLVIHETFTQLKKLSCHTNHGLELIIPDNILAQLTDFDYSNIKNEAAITQQYDRVRGGC